METHASFQIQRKFLDELYRTRRFSLGRMTTIIELLYITLFINFSMIEQRSWISLSSLTNMNVSL